MSVQAIEVPVLGKDQRSSLSENDSVLEHRSSQGSQRFRESTHLIPTPGSEGKIPRRFEPILGKLWVVIGIALLMISLAVGLEVALAFSQKNDGFRVPPRNIFQFASAQFLISFFPTLLVIPLALLWNAADWTLQWFQPYVTLSRGNAPASALLLDYIALNKFELLWTSLRKRQWVIYTSLITALASFLLQPLAGSVLTIRQLPQTQDGNVTSIRRIGLDPDFLSLNAFVAAAGFVEAAVFHRLPDPPFIQGGWSAAEFVFPINPGLNGSMALETTGVQTKVNCANPTSQKLDSQGGNITITSTSDQSCTASVNFIPASADRQYGVKNVPNCGPITDIQKQPVMFWFFHNTAQGPEAKSVFCQPTIRVCNILATANLTNGSLVGVHILNDYVVSNNVTGAPNSGQAFNGVIFNPSQDPFVQARAIATASGLAGAIFRSASQLPNGPDSAFSNPNGFLDITRRLYTQHLSIIAKSIYYTPVQDVVVAKMTSIQPRLLIDPLSAHALASVLLFIGVVGIAVHIVHYRQRRNLRLTSPPGSIGAVVSLTSRSGFGELLVPYDDERSIMRKLAGLRFRLDSRTGAILAEEDGSVGFKAGRDDAMMSLLGQRYQQGSSVPDFGHPQHGMSNPWPKPYDP